MIIHRRKQINISHCLARLKLNPRALWNKNTQKGARPVKDQLGIEHGDRSVAVQRA